MARNSEEILTDRPPRAADARLAYGSEPKQFGDLRLPDVDRLWPLAVVVHGGAWKAMYNLMHTGHLCVALGDAGIATWNVEYRSVGDVDGGWPAAGDDVAAAAEYVGELVERYPLDRERLVLVGHSAGGQLALYAAKGAELPVVALAPVSGLRQSAERVAADGPVRAPRRWSLLGAWGRAGVVAISVAVRGMSRSSASSPEKSPRRASARTPLVTSSAPSATM